MTLKIVYEQLENDDHTLSYWDLVWSSEVIRVVTMPTRALEPEKITHATAKMAFTDKSVIQPISVTEKGHNFAFL